MLVCMYVCMYVGTVCGRDYYQFHGDCFASLLLNALQKICGAIGVLE